ncbi:MAG: hypothetical protein U0791_26810 [Gemmataceae bacterium]
MIPQRKLEKSVGCLMAALGHCRVYDPATSVAGDSPFMSTGDLRVVLPAVGVRAVKAIIALCVPYLDSYPVDSFDSFLRRNCIADAYELNASPADASHFMRGRLEEFFKRLDDAGVWEAVLAVTGFNDGQPGFTIGPCRFFKMTAAEFHLWQQREWTGQYNPPPDTPVARGPQQHDRQIINNWVAATRVKAMDGAHASSKARIRLEEVLNVIRCGTLQFGKTHHCPRVGTGQSNFWDGASICMQIEGSRGFTRSNNGAEPTTIHTCEATQAWPNVVTLVAKEQSARTPLESAVISALEWVGQAAAAALPSVQLVLLATALEVLVMGKSEFIGKKSKFSKRIGRIILSLYPSDVNCEKDAHDVYRLRSECLHEGATRVERADVMRAFHFVTTVIKAYLTTEPYRSCNSIQDVLDLLEPPSGLTYEI